MSVCEYCHPDLDDYIRLLPRKGKGTAAIYPSNHGSRLVVSGPFNTKLSIPIKYCPICGRELEGEQEL